jgi:hypothetical protein
MKNWFIITILYHIINVLTNDFIDVQNSEEAEKLYKTDYKSQCTSSLRYLQTDANPEVITNLSTDINPPTGTNNSGNAESPSSTTLPSASDNSNPVYTQPTNSIINDISVSNTTNGSAAGWAIDTDYKPASNSTSIYDNNPNLLNKLIQTPRKLFSGNFWNTISGYIFKNYTDISSKAKLKMVFTLARQGVYRPDSNILGDYYDSNGNRIKSNFIFEENEKYTDIYGNLWPLKYVIDEKGYEFAKNYSESLKSLYTDLGLLTGNPNETDFVTTEKNVTLVYSKKVIQYLYPKFNATNIETAPFSFEELDKFSYNPKIAGKVLAILQREYRTKYFGFGMDSCPKWANFQQKAMKDTFLLKEYNSTFIKLIDAWEHKFQGKVYYKTVGSNDTYLKIDRNQLETNLTLVAILTEAFRSDMVYFETDPEQYTSFKKYILETDEDFAMIKNLRKFLTYEFILYSNLHTFLVVGPFFDLMFAQFNKLIAAQGTYQRKMMHFTVSDWIISAIYKMFYYDKTYYRYNWDPNDPNNNDKWIYKKLPLITFGYNIQFELWEWKDKSRSFFYIMFRENLAKEPTFILKAEDFMWALKLFYLDPNFDNEERVFWCGQ